MAISLIQKPQSFTPAYNQNVWVFDSNLKSQPGFRYLVKIYSEPSNTLIATLRVAPTPTTGFGYVDISKILSDNVNYDIDVLSTTNISAPNSIFNYKLIVSEEFTYTWDFSDTTAVTGGGRTRFQGSTPPVFTIGDQISTVCDDPNLFPASNGLFTITGLSINAVIVDLPFVTTALNPGDIVYSNQTKTVITGPTYSSNSVFNGAESFSDFISYTEANFIIPSNPVSVTRSLLTDLPAEFTCTLEQDLFLNMYKQLADYAQINAKFENSNGDILIKEVWTNASTSRLAQFSAGPNNALPTTVVSGTVPLIKSDTKWYDVWLSSSQSKQLTRKYRVYLDKRCKIEDYEILFLDRMGSWSSYAFQLRSKETGTISRDDYNNTIGTISNAGAWSYTSTSAGDTTYNVNTNKILELNTNWMTDDMSVYFEQLLTSPKTFIKIDGVYFNCLVQDSGFEVHRHVNKVLIKKTVKVKLVNEIINI